jgi:hypothetical protein
MYPGSSKKQSILIHFRFPAYFDLFMQGNIQESIGEQGDTAAASSKRDCNGSLVMI